MNVSLDWNKLDRIPGDNDKCFEEFCFHVAQHLFGHYGTMNYFYNTPGSEFYVKMNKPVEYAGVRYKEGDVIGWQCKYWRGAHDDDNSPLGATHINELAIGLRTSLKRQPNIKLWVVCTPGAFVEDQWKKLIEKLTAVKSDCFFESWHKTTFHGLYLEDVSSYNGLFQYYFGQHIGKLQLDELTKDTLETLKNKFDLELHIPTSFEDSLLTIVDNEKARKILKEKIESVVERSDKDRKEDVFRNDSWLYPLLTEHYKKAYTEDLIERYVLCDRLKGYLLDDSFFAKADEIKRLIEDYREKRYDRVDLLNSELQSLYKNNKDNGSLDYVVSEMVQRIFKLEDIITEGRNKENVSILDILTRMLVKDFSVFAEAGHGKTHFACSVATNMLNREKPAILVTGSQFRNCNGCESKLIELLKMPNGSTIGDALDVLDYLGELYQCRIPIIVDGLNEAAPNEKRWKEELPPLRRKIRERNNLVLITTCREKEEYINAIYGCKSYEKTDHPILLPGIEDKNLLPAVTRYFNKYNIQPNTLAAHNLFSNPLLLKIFCETNKDRGSFDVNDYTLATCMKDYSDNLITSIATTDSKHDKILHHKIEKGLNKISWMIWNRGERSVDFYTDFAEVFENQTDAFLNEGMCFMIDNVGGEERIQFSYDLVAGYHIAKAIVDNNRTAVDYCEFIDKQFARLFGDERHTLAEDVIKSLFYLVPMHYGKEWFELMPRNEIAIAAMDHLDIIAFEEPGRIAFANMLSNGIDGQAGKKKMCDRLFDRISRQNNLLHLRMFIPFFNGMDVKEMDIFWNSKFAGYGTLSSVAAIVHDNYWANRYSLDDKVTFALLLCGIVDKEFRFRFIEELFLLVVSDIDRGLDICGEALFNKDPFIIEAVVSVITGIGLRATEKELLGRCVLHLEGYLERHTSTPVYLLDDLETLYSYGKQCFGMNSNNSILSKNKSEQWPIVSTDKYRLYALYDYDYEKYNIRPLIENGWRRKAVLRPDKVHGMLLKRVLDYGYDEDAYDEIQKKEEKEVNYRHELRLGYGEKLGRSAIKELYGWLLVNGKLKGEYKGTYRSDVIDIDPSFPKIPKKRTFVCQSLLTKDITRLPEWTTSSNIDLMEKMFIAKLPRTNGEWVLMRGYFEQRIDEKYSNIYLSGFSELIPAKMKKKEVERHKLRNEIDLYHAFFGEIGWRHLEMKEDYEDDWPLPDLLVHYTFSSWSQERFRYPMIYLLNEVIVKKVGLVLDIDSMEYHLNGEPVSVHFINDTDQFFYLRRDVVDDILIEYDAKIRYHLYERRMVKEKLPKSVPEIKERFIQNEKDIFYVARLGVRR